ncbi:hypothetical protein ACLOJK_037970 [Asimina triloba]
MGGYARVKMFRGSSPFRNVFPKRDPLVKKVATFREYFFYPGVMLTALYHCPEELPDRKKQPQPLSQQHTVSSST